MPPFTSASRVEHIQAPVIPIVAQWIRETPGTLSLGQGVVYYGPPKTIGKKIQEFMRDPALNKYGAVNGDFELRRLIQLKLQKEEGIDVSLGRKLMVTAGGNMAFSHAIFALCNPGDEVILPLPFYFNHEMAIQLAGCVPVLVPTDANYQLQLGRIRKAITPKTRAIVTVSPNNPTGVIYPQEDLFQLNQLCRRKKLFHIHDAAYEYFSYGGNIPSNPLSFPDSTSHTISLHSLSKSYGFASWRIGYMVYPEALYESMRKIQDTHLICPSLIAQYAACAALEAGKLYSTQQLPAIQRSRDIFLEELSTISSICQVPESNGAFYFLLKIDTDLSSMELVERLIREHKVATIPGSTFGLTEGCYIRIAYGSLQETQAKVGIGRLVKGLQAILG
ncbi:MAG: pyridoxal phosphate-dependent aminotransferase [Bacteroidota bacterium]